MDVVKRIAPLLKIHFYVTQIIGDSINSNSKLHEFKLAETPASECGEEQEIADHVLIQCKFYEKQRKNLKKTLKRLGKHCHQTKKNST